MNTDGGHGLAPWQNSLMFSSLVDSYETLLHANAITY